MERASGTEAPPRRAAAAAAEAEQAGRHARGENGSGGAAPVDALLFATTPAGDGGPAAALDVLGTPLVRRLLDQLDGLGVRHVWLLTRPEWVGGVEAAVEDSRAEVSVVTAASLSEDLGQAAQIAEGARGPLIVANAHVVIHGEALRGLLADPRSTSGALAIASHRRAQWFYGIRSVGQRILGASSPFHYTSDANGYFLELMKVAERDRGRLAAASRALEEIAADPLPERWEEELDRKADAWRLDLRREALEREAEASPAAAALIDPDDVQVGEAGEAEIARRRGAAAQDAVALLLVGLVREGAELFPTFVRGFFFAAPVSEEAAGVAGEELEAADEDRVLLDSAVKARDGFFTTFFVSPYSKYLARFAARRGWTPNAVTIASLAIGIAAAASFATGSRAGLIAGAILLQVSFSVDCVDGQLARYTRTFSKLGAWLDSVFDRTKEYVVYAGLAIGATRGFDDDVWVLAAVALTLQTVRHLDDFSWGASRRGPAAQPSRKPPLDEPYDAGPPEPLAPLEPVPAPVDVSLAWRVLRRCYVLARGVWRAGVRWGHRILRFPIGERFILISVTAAIWSPRVTFVALLVWGALAAAYTLVGRLLIAFDNPRAVRAVPK